MLSTLNGSYYLGKGKFLPGLKKVGKFTRGVTTTVAKAFLPPSLVDAAASFDPTKKKSNAAGKSAMELLKPAPAPVAKLPVKKAKMALPIVPLAIGGLAIVALIVISKKGR